VFAWGWAVKGGDITGWLHISADQARKVGAKLGHDVGLYCSRVSLVGQVKKINGGGNERTVLEVACIQRAEGRCPEKTCLRSNQT